MKWRLTLLAAFLQAISSFASVRVFVQDTNGVAWLKYQCTAGEVVRAFALDVTVDQGIIFRVSDFLVGVSKPGAQGYGRFPERHEAGPWLERCYARIRRALGPEFVRGNPPCDRHALRPPSQPGSQC